MTQYNGLNDDGDFDIVPASTNGDQLANKILDPLVQDLKSSSYGLAIPPGSTRGNIWALDTETDIDEMHYTTGAGISVKVGEVDTVSGVFTPMLPAPVSLSALTPIDLEHTGSDVWVKLTANKGGAGELERYVGLNVDGRLYVNDSPTIVGARKLLQSDTLTEDQVVDRNTDQTIGGTKTWFGSQMLEALLTLSRPSGEQMKIGYDTGIFMDPYLSFYNGKTTRTAFIQSQDDHMQIKSEEGGDLKIYGSKDARLNNERMVLGDDESIVKANQLIAWVAFEPLGTLSIRNSYNVSSVTDVGTGIYQVNIADNAPNDEYAVVVSTAGDRLSPAVNGNRVIGSVYNNGSGISVKTTGAVRVCAVLGATGTYVDPDEVYVLILGS